MSGDVSRSFAVSGGTEPPSEPVLSAYGDLPLAQLVERAAGLAQAGEALQACAVYAQWLQQRLRSGQGREPGCAVAWFNLGVLRAGLGQLAAAQAAYQRALAVQPGLVAARVNLGLLLERQGQPAQALAVWAAGVPAPADQSALLTHMGRLFEDGKRYAEAEAALHHSLALHPEQPDVVQHWVHLRAKQCRWPVLAPLSTVQGRVLHPRVLLPHVGPFATLALTDDAQVCLDNTTRWLAERGWATKAPPPMRPRVRGLQPGAALQLGQVLGRRLRVGYASADLHHHATGMLLVEVLERCDRERFEQVALSWGPDDGTPLRARLRAAFDEWHEVGALPDEAVLALVQQAGIDVWVDLKGLTQHARPGLFAHRVAPVQVAFLGFPGSVPLAHMDYAIVDRVVAPPALRGGYAEALVCLPDTYQPNDRQRVVAQRAPSRAECGLPEGAFVFCCFNSNYKITPEVFALWMRLLRARPGSVLWLIRSHAEAQRHLQAQAQAQGVDPQRLVFAPVVHISEHLARHVHADVFLDTFPCNAHTTASDALWMGVPVLTRAGRAFASRVAASLVAAAGVPELACLTERAYEAAALRLSGPEGAAELAALRQRLAAQRDGCALFDSERFTRHLEDAFAAMWMCQARGLPPADMDIPARPGVMA